MADFEDKIKAAFEAEQNRPLPPNLRYRVISNAVATPRRRGFVSWFTVPRLAAAGAVAAVALAAGIGFRIATTPGSVVANQSPTPSAQLAFGKLPPPGLHPPQGLGGGGAGTSVIPFFGPAQMTWGGQLPKTPASAPVYRFTLPSDADADAFAARLGARLSSTGTAKTGRTYKGPGPYSLIISTDPVAGEPVFILNREAASANSGSLSDQAASSAAGAELARLGLTPPWPYQVEVSSFQPLGTTAPIYNVVYQRVVHLAGGVTAGEVDGNGDPYGIQVTVDARGTVLRITGSLRLAEQSGAYPTQRGSAVITQALNAAPLQPATGPDPSVTLSRATLVYIVSASGDTGYLEPAYLFTGRFTQPGATLEKRVLVPAVNLSALS